MSASPDGKWFTQMHSGSRRYEDRADAARMEISAYDRPISTLPESESWKPLASVQLVRLITGVGGQPEVFPVNFIYRERTEETGRDRA
jgi:hypothetical protein